MGESLLNKSHINNLESKMRQSILLIALLFLLVAGCRNNGEQEEGMEKGDSSSALNDPPMTYAASIQDTPHVAASHPFEAGRYLVIIGQCNDCHTEGYEAGNVLEEDWLTGSSIGWQGPWGTTYPSNLRLRVNEWTEDQWVEMLKTRQGLPPMPWINLNKYSEQDMRAMYKYIESLGPKGEHRPLAVGPGMAPLTPYLIMSPQNPPTTVVNQ